DRRRSASILRRKCLAICRPPGTGRYLLSIYHRALLDRPPTITTSEPARPPHTQRRTLGRDVGDRGDRCALRAADLDQLLPPCCDQPVHGAAAHPDHVGRLGGGGNERFHDYVPFLP